MTHERKIKFTTGSVLAVALAALAITMLLSAMLSGDAETRSQFVPVDSYHQSRYEPFSGLVKPGDYPRVINGKKNLTGMVINVADANTPQTRKACLEDWLANSAYQVLCVGLADQKILTIRLDRFSMPLTARVPVSKIAKVNVGEKILFKSADTESNGDVVALPQYVRTMAF